MYSRTIISHERKKKRINYQSRDVAASYRTGLELFKHTSILVEGQYVKRYCNSFYLLTKLSKSERLFLDFITEYMDHNNIVANNQATRDYFNEFMTKIGIETYSKSTIHKCFSSLSKHFFIDSIKGKRGLYQVNPLYFFKGSETDREALIRTNLESINREKLNVKRHLQMSSGKYP